MNRSEANLPELPNSSERIQNKDGDLQPQTLAQRLKGEVVGVARDLRGTALRLASYISIFTVEFATLRINGVPEDTSMYIAFGTLVPIMVAGESFVFRQLSRRFPWFEVSSLDFRPRQ